MDFVAGYRLIRLLGSGRRADVFLGQAERADMDATDPGQSAESAPVSIAAVKVWRPGTERAVIDLELAALARLRSAHLMRLDDIALAGDGLPVLVCQRLSQTSLAHLLEARGQFSAGEAVTIIAPIAGAVSELHRSGVAHRRLRLGAVLFDDTMAPVVTSFGRATLIGPPPRTPDSSSLTPAALAADVTVERDLADLAALARTILESTRGSVESSRLLAWLREVSPGRNPHLFPLELTERLFDLAEAEPIDLGAARPDVPHRTHANGTFAIDTDELFREQLEAGAPQPVRSPPALRLLIPEWIAEHIDDSPLSAIGGSLVRSLTQVRRPVWIALATAVVLLAGAVVLTSAGARTEAATGAGASDEVRPSAEAVGIGSGVGVDHAAGDPVASDAEVAPTPSDAVVGPDGTVESRSSPLAELTTDQSAVLAGDDPVAAGRLLLERRAACFGGGGGGGGGVGVGGGGGVASPTAVPDVVTEATAPATAPEQSGMHCLVHIMQAESATLDDDRDLLEAADGAADARAEADRFAASELQLDDRLGGSAIIAVSDAATGTPTASLLLVKGEAGWLLRDLIRL